MSMKLRYFLPLFLGVFALVPTSAHATVLYTGGSGTLHQFSSTYWDWTGHTSGQKTVDPVNTVILLPSGGGPTQPFDMRIPTAPNNTNRAWVIYPQKVGGGTLTNTDCGYFSAGFSYSSGGSGVNSFVANAAGTGCITDMYGFYSNVADAAPYWGFTVGINNSGQLANYYYPTGALKVCDDFSECNGSAPPPPPITPPSTDFNEVIRYWPAFNYSTSTGTTTVGVQFSIPHPELIEGVGFELGGATNLGTSTVAEVSTLYTATTTVSTAQTFSMTTDYNFTSGGYYSISAFFIQNGRRVYNNTNATILINYVPPNITIGNDGQFHFNGTTTVATSTLDALHIDCGDTFIVASICKLAVSFIIPDPSAVQGVKDNFSLILTKAPFSFFTDSKKLLDAFQTGTAATGGTFALTFYGQSAPIVSTTTAASIGLGTTPINTLKDLEIIGLWILLAWYLYWRIASIFGV